MKLLAHSLLLLAAASQPGWSEDLPAGRIVTAVKCGADASQTYALYLPSNYSPDRAWPVIFAFDPAGRGTVPVERYQAAAETYGYIVAGSNNSRNGPWDVSTRAARAMIVDAGERFPLDTRRVYTAGMSGGARVALGVALGSRGIAGVIASSAGFPDSKPRKTVRFVVFGTAGTEDFNLSEMRQMDGALTSPHRLAVFEGGHVWLSSALAMKAVEWMEVQAVKAGASKGSIDAIFAKRTAAVESLASDRDRLQAFEAMVADFAGLKDVSAFAARAAELRRDKHVRNALKMNREDEAREQRETRQILTLESQLAAIEQRSGALGGLRSEWKRLAGVANGPVDTPERRMARRVLRGLAMGSQDRVADAEYQKIIDEYRLRGR
jgi:poly(3-hydroxybutyrate) depolymerase